MLLLFAVCGLLLLLIREGQAADSKPGRVRPAAKNAEV
jgi:hypothetical protein